MAVSTSAGLRGLIYLNYEQSSADTVACQRRNPKTYFAGSALRERDATPAASLKSVPSFTQAAIGTGQFLHLHVAQFNINYTAADANRYINLNIIFIRP